MPIIILIPGLLCALALLRGNTQRAFFNVVLPSVMLLPTSYQWKVSYLPPMNFLEAAMVPLGIGMALTNLSKWKFSRTDIWMALYFFSAGFTEYRIGLTTDSVFDLFRVFTTALVPYMAGKLLIEQTGTRVRTAKRLVWLLFGVCIPSMAEFFVKINPFTYFWSHFFTQWTGFVTQPRWGFGRVAGPYIQSESTGLVLITGLFLTVWLANWSLWEPRFRQLPAFPLRKQTVISVTLLTTLSMTMARGPWFGAALGWCIAFIGRANHLLRRSIIVLTLMLAVGTPTYIAAKQYLDAPTTSAEQQTAQYRQQLWQNYLPIAQMGGAWGWGSAFPIVGYQNSIDNQYLYAYLTQGYVGLAMFVLILLDSAGTVLKLSLRSQSKRDRQFHFTLLAILTGFAVTLTTVYLGCQPYPIFFLLVGWSQALRFHYADERTDGNLRLETLVHDAETLRVFT